MKRFLFVLLFICQVFFAFPSNLKRDSLKRLLAVHTDSLFFDVLFQLGESYLSDSPDSANYYAGQILHSTDSLFVAKAYYLKGKAAYKNCNYSNTVSNIETAISYWSEIKPVENADCYNLLGNAFSKMENYKLSLSSYFTSLNIRSQLGDSLLISSSLNNIGNVYFQMSDYNNALEYYNRSFLLKSKKNDVLGIAIIYNNKGNIYHKLGDSNKALNSYFRALKVVETQGGISWRPILLENIGQLYLDKGESSKAMIYYQRALLESGNLGDKISVGNVKLSIAKVYLQEGQYNKSLNLLEDALAVAKEIGVPKLEMDCYYNLSALYEAKNNYEKSISCLKSYDQIRERIYKENNSREIAEIQTKHQLGKIDKENEILKQENIIQELEIAKQELRSRYLLSLGILILALVFYSMYVNRFRKRHNKILKEKNKIIYQKNSSLTNLNATKDKFLSIVAHDLKNPFNAVLGFTDLLIDRFSELDDSMRKEYIEIIHKSALHGSLLLDTLLTWSRSQMGVMKYNPEVLNISRVVVEEIEGLEDKAYAKNISIDFSDSEVCFVNADPDMVRTVIRNLGNNAIKFTEERGKIVFSIQAKEGKAIISVEDNGIGIKPEDIVKLFKLDSNYSRSGTSNEKGTGLGLILCKDFIEKNAGEIGVESQESKGSRFWFTLPLHVELEKKASTHEEVEELLSN